MMQAKQQQRQTRSHQLNSHHPHRRGVRERKMTSSTCCACACACACVCAFVSLTVVFAVVCFSAKCMFVSSCGGNSVALPVQRELNDVMLICMAKMGQSRATLSVFCNFLKEMGLLCPLEFAQHIFATINHSKTAHETVHAHFVTFQSVLALGSLEEKVELFYELMDFDHDGYLSSSDIFQAMQIGLNDTVLKHDVEVLLRVHSHTVKSPTAAPQLAGDSSRNYPESPERPDPLRLPMFFPPIAATQTASILSRQDVIRAFVEQRSEPHLISFLIRVLHLDHWHALRAQRASRGDVGEEPHMDDTSPVNTAALYLVAALCPLGQPYMPISVRRLCGEKRTVVSGVSGICLAIELTRHH
jgi:Ca2+-binding EF-hand superfamily protein